MDGRFWSFYGLQFLNGCDSISYIYIYYGLVFKGVLVFVMTKTKTPEFTVKFDLNLSGKSRREGNFDRLALFRLQFDFIF